MRGGDIIFQAGLGAMEPDGRQWPDGDIIFKFANGTEALRLYADGRVTANGVMVETEKERASYRAFRMWLDTVAIIPITPTLVAVSDKESTDSGAVARCDGGSVK